MLYAGDLNHRITIEKNEPLTNTDGAQIENWVVIESVWADYQASSGKEFFAAQRLNTEVSVVFRVRFQSGLDTKMRVKYRGRTFGILFLNDSGRDRGELVIACREVV